MWPLFLFAALPIAEIAVFIMVGSKIGVLATIGLILLSGAAGTMLLRQGGARTAGNLQTALNGMRHPGAVLAEGALTMIAGILLIVPGFLTDLAAIALLVPPVRAMILRSLAARVRVSTPGEPRGPVPGGPEVIDGEWSEVQTEDAQRLPPSGWTRH